MQGRTSITSFGVVIEVPDCNTKSKKYSKLILTSRPKNLPMHANKCKTLFLLKLIKALAAVILPWFSASSHSSKVFDDIMLFDERRRK